MKNYKDISARTADDLTNSYNKATIFFYPYQLTTVKAQFLNWNQGLTLAVMYELYFVSRVQSCSPSLDEVLFVKVACHVLTCSQRGMFHVNFFNDHSITNPQNKRKEKRKKIKRTCSKRLNILT